MNKKIVIAIITILIIISIAGVFVLTEQKTPDATQAILIGLYKYYGEWISADEFKYKKVITNKEKPIYEVNVHGETIYVGVYFKDDIGNKFDTIVGEDINKVGYELDLLKMQNSTN